MDAVGGAGGGTHEAGHTADAIVFVLVQSVNATEGGTLLAAFDHGPIVSFFFGVLDHVDVVFVFPWLGYVAEQVPERRAKPFGDRRQKDGFCRVHGLWSDVDNGLFGDGHGKNRIVASEPVAS